jgi:hypothetical protein
VKRLRRKPALTPLPVPRAELEGRRAEAEFFDQAFAERLWRRPTPI